MIRAILEMGEKFSEAKKEMRTNVWDIGESRNLCKLFPSSSISFTSLSYFAASVETMGESEK
jgi:hypothetical protein